MCRLRPEALQRTAQDVRFLTRPRTRLELAVADALHDNPRLGRRQPDVLQVKADGPRPESGKAAIEADRRASWRASQVDVAVELLRIDVAPHDRAADEQHIHPPIILFETFESLQSPDQPGLLQMCAHRQRTDDRGNPEEALDDQEDTNQRGEESHRGRTGDARLSELRTGSR